MTQSTQPTPQKVGFFGMFFGLVFGWLLKPFNDSVDGMIGK